jgi:hypothetical protein
MMKKYIIMWDAGCGENYEVIEAADSSSASTWAYTNWKEEALSNANYYTKPYTKELAVDIGIEEEED